MDYNSIAHKVYKDLKDGGAEIGNYAIMIIEKSLSESVPAETLVRQGDSQPMQTAGQLPEQIFDDKTKILMAAKTKKKTTKKVVGVDALVMRTERGWAGHFICGHRCLFRRNTLLEYKNIKIVVSTVGMMLMDYNANKYDTIGPNRNYETMAFHVDKNDKKYHDADVSRQISFESEWAIAEQFKDNEANKMHEDVVVEITENLKAGAKYA